MSRINFVCHILLHAFGINGATCHGILSLNRLYFGDNSGIKQVTRIASSLSASATMSVASSAEPIFARQMTPASAIFTTSGTMNFPVRVGADRVI
jgi:hypothetical protein